MNAEGSLAIICVTFLFGIISLIFQIYVSRQLTKAGQKVSWPIGKRSWITPFAAGWKNANQLELTEIMISWSIVLVVTWIGVIASAFAILAYKA
jgi:hypothetical protein